MKIILRKFDLKLQHTFTIARDSYDSQPTVIVELKDGEFSGYGEAISKEYYGISIQNIIKDINSVKFVIEAIDNLLPEDFWLELYPYFKQNMFALCALDMAYNDLYARKKGLKLYEYWGLDTANNPKTNYTIGIDSVENMVAKLKAIPWPIYKIKLGTKDDIKIIKELRKHTDATFRVDANCGWTVDELPIIADESCQTEVDVDTCYNHFHGINVKLVKCGGLTSAKRMLYKARELHMKTMVGCIALLLTNDIAKGVVIENGNVSYSNSNGIGVTLMT